MNRTHGGLISPSRSKLLFGLYSVHTLLVLTVGMAAANTIHVTTTTDKIVGSGTGGCSLQVAIYSANFDNNIAIDSITLTSNPTDRTEHFVTQTDCEPGDGDDTIELETGQVYQTSRIVDDAHNLSAPYKGAGRTCTARPWH